MGRGIEISECILALEVDSPDTQSIALAEYTIEGTVALKEGGRAAILTSYTFTDAEAEAERAIFSGPLAGPFSVTRVHREQSRAYRRCGRQTPVTMTVSAMAQNTSDDAYASVSVTRIRDIKFAVVPCIP